MLSHELTAEYPDPHPLPADSYSTHKPKPREAETPNMCTLEKRGDIFYLTLTGGGEEHRLNPTVIASIRSALREAREQSTRGSALITVADGKFFSNGFDLAWAQAAGPGTAASRDRLYHMVSLFKPVVADLVSLPMPTIAAVTGHAAAAGMVLALSHDYVLMRSDRGVARLTRTKLTIIIPLEGLSQYPKFTWKTPMQSPFFVPDQTPGCHTSGSECTGEVATIPILQFVHLPSVSNTMQSELHQLLEKYLGADWVTDCTRVARSAIERCLTYDPASLDLTLSTTWLALSATEASQGVLYMSELDIGLTFPDYFTAIMRSKVGSPAAWRDVMLKAAKLRAAEAVAMGIIDSAYDSAQAVLEAAVRLGGELIKRKWNGEIYAEIRKALYPELCGMLGLTNKVVVASSRL
ncbi:indole-3-butyric acid response 10 [Actinidia rufa]|uniref:Indole-3-butyric acid response 10 n=1 Tax=Actinidia rufa TaxID=165716 RepID=A0A7J0EFK6_9ERIC|nr:indole-3-butyric acid response 10 [Actinidia rufa]